jgi:hypothetical protein
LSWWSEKIEIAEPPIDAFSEALARVRALKASLDSLDKEMLAFRTANKVRTDRFSRLLAIECPTLNGRAAIEFQWRSLLRRRDKLANEWHAALHRYAELKEAAK